MLSRRQFLIGTAGAAAGLILPDWVARAERYIEGEGRPWLERPARPASQLSAIDWGDGEFQLFLGDPDEPPPRMNWAEFADTYFGMPYEEFLREHLGKNAATLDEEEGPNHGLGEDDEVPEWQVLDLWVYQDSPSAQAFSYLEGLDLGAELAGPRGVGAIHFIDGPCPGNDSRIVNAADELSLSLLQKRLNDLGEGIEVVVRGETS